MDADSQESLRSALESYRAALIDVGEAGARAYPPAGDNLKQSLLKLQEGLVATATPDALAQAQQHLGRRTPSYFAFHRCPRPAEWRRICSGSRWSCVGRFRAHLGHQKKDESRLHAGIELGISGWRQTQSLDSGGRRHRRLEGRQYCARPPAGCRRSDVRGQETHV